MIPAGGKKIFLLIKIKKERKYKVCFRFFYTFAPNLMEYIYIMQNNLVIVESPAKAKTIEKFLGEGYKVLSSYGHIRDLKKSDLSVDVNDHFKPLYEIPAEKAAVVKKLKAEADKADMVWLASDEDREGEAISWHLYEVLGLTPEKTKRIVFHEITPNAILNAIKHPRDINTDLVNAQQARRVLDRIVGFELSPVLWKKIKPSLSAGRVQSVAVRLIVEREREVHAFTSEASYRVTAVFTDTNGAEIRTELDRRFKTKEEAEDFLNSCKDATFTIDDITTRPLKKSPAPPFTTSTLQQEAARKLGFSVSQTMSIAQRLYENGLITYMRTDSVNLSELALNSCRETITELIGEKYVHTRQFHTKTKGAQEAHEAIRPTYMSNEAIEGERGEVRLYNLIWKRTLASQMEDATLEKTTATISISGQAETFTAIGETVIFDGFLRVYKESYDDENEPENDSRLLPNLKVGQTLFRKEITATQRFTLPPARYTEASLVRKLEELGIGRPSTYAPTISTIQRRGYVVKGDKEGTERPYKVLQLLNGNVAETVRTEITGSEKNKLIPTDVGIVVNDFLMKYFPIIMDYNFTAKVEKEFDEVAEGDCTWTDMMEHFYKDFHPLVTETKEANSSKAKGERILGTDPASGRQVAVKVGRFGPVVQIGIAGEAEKPRFAPLRKEYSMETITLEQALDLFKLPRTLGEWEGKPVVVGVGRFGSYIRHDNKFVSLPKETDLMAMTLEEAEQIILNKREAEAKKIIREFADQPELKVLNGRFGPYISYKKENYKIPKGIEAETLDAEACMQLIQLQKSKEEIRKPKAITVKATSKKKAK